MPCDMGWRCMAATVKFGGRKSRPAPPKIAYQIYTEGLQTKMIVRYMQGDSMEKTLAWGEREVEGFMRT